MDSTFNNVDMPKPVTCFDRTTIFEWYVVGRGYKKESPTILVFKKIIVLAQNMIVVSSSTIIMIRRSCIDHRVSTRIFIFDTSFERLRGK